MIWTVAKALGIVVALVLAWAGVDLLWRRVLGVAEDRRGCGSCGCAGTRSCERKGEGEPAATAGSTAA